MLKKVENFNKVTINATNGIGERSFVKKTTLQTIADKMGVSKALVSKALSNDPKVNDVTKERIWETAAALGYRIKNSKRELMSSKTGNIAVLMPRFYLTDNEYWGKVVQGIDVELSKNGYSMILSSLDLEKNDGLPPSIYENKVDGAILLGHLSQNCFNALKVRKLPFVLADSNIQLPETDHVLSNNFLGAYQATNYLIDLGHHNLSFVGDASSSWSFQERIRGFHQATLDCRVKLNLEIIESSIDGMGVSGTGNYILNSFENNLKTHLLKKDVSALFCANDMIAIETMKLAAKLGLNCPEDISIIGFDDLALCEHTQPQLSSVFVPKVQIGSRAAQLIIRRINDSSSYPELVQLSTFLVKRSSVKKLEL